jgi:hypothetical protein
MIKFKCIYCGQRILARDGSAGKKGKCPKCSHPLTVPESTKGRPAISFDKEPMPDRPASPHVPEWRKELRFDGDDGKDLWAEIFKDSFGFFLPAYDKLSIFLMAVTWILLYVVNNHLREQIHSVISEGHNWRISLIALMIPPVLVLGIYQVFAKREISDFERKILLAFAIATNIITGLVVGAYILRNADVRNWQLIFPIWNIINAVLLYLNLPIIFIEENCIIDRITTLSQIVFGLFAAVIIVLACNYYFKLHWSVTFSICIIYTTSFNRALQSVFPSLTRGEDEQASEG